MNLRLGGDIRLSRGGKERNRWGTLTKRSRRRQLGRRLCFQYVGLPIIHDGGLSGQALVCHERVTDEHDFILSPSERRQKVGEITIARDEDDCGWR